MTKLHELLAVQGNLSGQATKKRTDLTATFEKKRHLFEETRKTFTPNEELEIGKKIFIKRCSGCHLLHMPSQYSKEKWEKILPKMFVKAKVDTFQQRLIRNFIMNEK